MRRARPDKPDAKALIAPLVLILLALLALADTPATAQLLRGLTGASTGGGTPVAPTCNGTLNLSQGCIIPGMGP